MTQDCKHEYQLLGSVQETNKGGYGQWIRRDQFFCKYCLHIEIVTRIQEAKNDAHFKFSPNWWIK